jgi:hypothetical protein
VLILPSLVDEKATTTTYKCIRSKAITIFGNDDMADGTISDNGCIGIGAL